MKLVNNSTTPGSISQILSNTKHEDRSLEDIVVAAAGDQAAPPVASVSNDAPGHNVTPQVMSAAGGITTPRGDAAPASSTPRAMSPRWRTTALTSPCGGIETPRASEAISPAPGTPAGVFNLVPAVPEQLQLEHVKDAGVEQADAIQPQDVQFQHVQQLQDVQVQPEQIQPHQEAEDDAKAEDNVSDLKDTEMQAGESGPEAAEQAKHGQAEDKAAEQAEHVGVAEQTFAVPEQSSLSCELKGVAEAEDVLSGVKDAEVQLEAAKQAAAIDNQAAGQGEQLGAAKQTSAVAYQPQDDQLQPEQFQPQEGAAKAEDVVPEPKDAEMQQAKDNDVDTSVAEIVPKDALPAASEQGEKDVDVDTCVAEIVADIEKAIEDEVSAPDIEKAMEADVPAPDASPPATTPKGGGLLHILSQAAIAQAQSSGDAAEPLAKRRKKGGQPAAVKAKAKPKGRPCKA